MSPVLGFVIDKIGKRALFSKYLLIAKVQIAHLEIFSFSHVLICVHLARMHCHDVNPTYGPRQPPVPGADSIDSARPRLLSVRCRTLGLHPIYRSSSPHWYCIRSDHCSSKHWSHYLTPNLLCLPQHD